MYRRIQEEPELQKAFHEGEEALVDMGVGTFLEMVREGNTPCVLHFVKTKGRKRGYGEAVEIILSEEEKDPKELSTEELERLAALPSSG